jgi:hypothetical protein
LVLTPEHDDASPQPAGIFSSSDATDPTWVVTPEPDDGASAYLPEPVID